MSQPKYLLFVLLAGCHPKVFPKIEGPYAGLLSVSSTSTAQTIWQSSGVFLAPTDTVAAQKLRLEDQKQPLFMVQLPLQPHVSELLDSAQATIATGEGNLGWALVSIRSQEHLHALAHAAHAAPGFACGRIQKLFLKQKPQLPDDPEPAFYHEAIQLDAVSQLIDQVRSENIGSTIKELENLGTRQHNTFQGQQTPEFVKSLFEKTDPNNNLNTAYELISHDQQFTLQQSLIVALPGTGDDSTTVVLGAHLDSINRSNINVAPGADDDASGIATLLEIFRVLAENNVRFHRRIEFHAYGAEEIGLIGSGEIAQRYRSENRRVSAMVQVDMNSYSESPDEQTIHLITTDTTDVLRRSAALILNNYLQGQYRLAKLPSGTSDHKSWFNWGFPVLFPFENPEAYNTALHTARDTFETLNNLPLSARFSRFLIALLAHHAGLERAKSEYLEKKKEFNAELSSDLKLAVVASDSDFSVLVAAPSEVGHIEVCKMQSETRQSCLGGITRLERARKDNERSFFQMPEDEKITLNPGDHLLVRAFDAQDHLLAERMTTLIGKP